MKHLSTISALTAAVILTGCETSPLSSEEGEVALKLGEDEAYTLEQLDSVQGDGVWQIDKQLHEARLQLARSKATKYALAQEAEAQGVTQQELFNQWMDKQNPSVSDEEVEDHLETYREAAARADIEKLRPQVREGLRQRKLKEAQQDYLRSLFDKHDVEINLEAPRPAKVAKSTFNAYPDGAEYRIGPADAKVNMTAYVDFQCPHCANERRHLEAVQAENPGTVSLTYRLFPVTQPSGQAKMAARAGVCAIEQDAFEPLADDFFRNQRSITPDYIRSAGERIEGLDPDAFSECLEDPAAASTVETAAKEARAMDVRSTPALFMNRVRMTGSGHDRTAIENMVTTYKALASGEVLLYEDDPTNSQMPSSNGLSAR